MRHGTERAPRHGRSSRIPVYIVAALGAVLLVVLSRHACTAARPSTGPDVVVHGMEAVGGGSAQDSLVGLGTRDAASPESRPLATFDPEQANEARLFLRAQAQLRTHPDEALSLLSVADRRFGAKHEGRQLLRIRALVALGQIGRSHAGAARFYADFPNSPDRRTVERLTGYHPRPQGPGER